VVAGRGSNRDSFGERLRGRIKQSLLRGAAINPESNDYEKGRFGPMTHRLKNTKALPVLCGILVAILVGRAKGQPADGLNTPAAAEAESIPQSAYCNTATPLKNSASWNGYSTDVENSRFQPSQSAGISAADVPKLKLKWAFGFPGVTTSFGTPTVVGERLYIGSADGTVYALNAISGCIYWTYKAMGGVRTGTIISADDNVAYIGDLHASMHAVNAQTGAELWTVRVEDHPAASITGSPKLVGDRLYVPVSGGGEEVAARDPNFACCKFRGSLVALDAKTGKQIWKSYTISDPAKMTGKTAKGIEVWGPSGASVWSTPTIDLRKHAIYFGTGVNYTQPATKTSDAVFAFDTTTGKTLWSQQLIEGDVYNFACTTEDKLNCPANPGHNLDLGSSPMLKSLGGGERILVVAAKSGIVFGLDPDHQGKLVWQTRVSEGGVLGGVIWGGSSDDKAAYFSISDWNPEKPESGGGVVAVEIRTGKKLWTTPAPKPACLETKGCSAAQPGATSVIQGAVFAGSLDGHLRAYDTADGRIIWDFDTLRDFVTVDQVKARGGSITGTGPSIVGGFVYASAGYSRYPMIGGNVLLAFSVDGK
jgi:polyvinyl alcohol dehydrogenase (cytochrome)